MPYPLFTFSTPGQQQDQSGAAGMQQYNAQAGNGVDPGKAPAMQAPTAPALGQALQNQIAQQNQQQQSQQNGQFAAGNQALATGAQNGSVGPTTQNAALQQQLMQQNGVGQPQPTWGQQAGGYLSNLFNGNS